MARDGVPGRDARGPLGFGDVSPSNRAQTSSLGSGHVRGQTAVHRERGNWRREHRLLTTLAVDVLIRELDSFVDGWKADSEPRSIE